MRPYKETGNLEVDIIAACINHYGYQGRRLSRIVVHPNLWKGFSQYVTEQGGDIEGDYVNFDGVHIVKGTTLMIKTMYPEFLPSKQEILN